MIFLLHVIRPHAMFDVWNTVTVNSEKNNFYTIMHHVYNKGFRKLLFIYMHTSQVSVMRYIKELMEPKIFSLSSKKHVHFHSSSSSSKKLKLDCINKCFIIILYLKRKAYCHIAQVWKSDCTLVSIVLWSF